MTMGVIKTEDELAVLSDALIAMSTSSILADHQSSVSHHKLGSRQYQTVLTNSSTVTTIPITTIDGNSNSVTEDCVFYQGTDTATGGAKVLVGDSVTIIHDITNAITPKVHLANCEYESTARALKTKPQHHENCNLQKSSHVVRIKINPKCDSSSSKVISAVRLNLEYLSSAYNFQINDISNDKCSNITYADNSNNSNNYNNINNDEHNRNNNTYTTTSNSAKIDNNTEPYIKIKVKSSESHFSDNESTPEKHQDHVSINTRNTKDGQIVQNSNISEPLNTSGSYNSCFYYGNPLNLTVIANGQNSLSETLDNGTDCDLDDTPPPLHKQMNSNTVMISSNTTMLACHNYHHSYQRCQRTGSSISNEAEVDNHDNESIISCDSLNSNEVLLKNNNKFKISKNLELRTVKKYCIYEEKSLNSERDILYSVSSENDDNKYFDNSRSRKLNKKCSDCNNSPSILSIDSGTLLLPSLITRIRSSENATPKRSNFTCSTETMNARVVNECTYQEHQCYKKSHSNNKFILSIDGMASNNSISKYTYNNDQYYKFHINEREEPFKEIAESDDECFAGYKILNREVIRSAKGTVRGVKNRVRAGIATFLQKSTSKNYKVKDSGKVVIYTTTMGIVRDTYYRCVQVKQILRTHMIKYEERDMYMSVESQIELRDRIGCTAIQVPQLFIDGQYIGDANTVERLNESGELRLMLKPYKSLDACNTCKICGGYCLLLCPVCNGSKKSMRCNDFTTEFTALKCMNCDEVGLVRCQHC